MPAPALSITDETEFDLEALAAFARPGLACQVADDRGRTAVIVPKLTSADVVVADAEWGVLSVGARVTGRHFDQGRIHILTFEVEEREDTLEGREDVLLRLVAETVQAEDRRAPRVEFDAAASCTLVDHSGAMLSTEYEIRVVQLSISGYAFLSDRAFDNGQVVDVTFDDDAGTALRGRVQIVRAERAVYGRVRYGARIVAIGELDSLRLSRLVNRVLLQEEVRREAEEALRAAAAEESERPSGGVFRLFRR